MTASLAEINVTDDILYLGLLAMDHSPDGWRHIHELCKETMREYRCHNVFARITAEMEKACKISEILPIRSDWILVKTFPKKIDANRLVIRVPGVTLHDFTAENLRDLVAYDELIMNCKRHSYLSVRMFCCSCFFTL